MDPNISTNLFHFAVVGCDDWPENNIQSLLFENEDIVRFQHRTADLELLMQPGKGYIWQIHTLTKIFGIGERLRKWADNKIRGIALYEEPLTSSISLARMETFFPTTKLIYMVKHPIHWTADAISKIRHNAEEQLNVLKELQIYEDSMKEKQDRKNDVDKRSDEYDDEPIQYANQRTNEGSTADQHSLSDDTSVQTGQDVQVDEEQERKRGNELYAAGKYVEAIQVYTRCIQLDGKSSLAYSNRGREIVSGS